MVDTLTFAMVTVFTVPVSVAWRVVSIAAPSSLDGNGLCCSSRGRHGCVLCSDSNCNTDTDQEDRVLVHGGNLTGH